MPIEQKACSARGKGNLSRKKRAHAKDEAGEGHSGGIAIAVAVVTCPLPNRWAEEMAFSSVHPRVLTLGEVQVTKGGSAGRI